jgi:serine protease Do
MGIIFALGVCLTMLLPGASAQALAAGDDLTALEKSVPENVEDLLAIQKQVHKVLAHVTACTVGVQMGRAAGSGVIVSEDGFVLTAGHVASEPDREVTLILSDGKKIKGKTLGINRRMDSGLIKITTPGKWPYAPMGDSSKLHKGQWCLALGHPGGYKRGRPPVVRLGRILDQNDRFIQSDCALVGGDSGGPLFDLEGKVIGIHSRISESITANIHVPVDTFRETWDRLVKGDEWGSLFGRRPRRDAAYLGVIIAPDVKGCVIEEVIPESPADKAGLKEKDEVIRFDGTTINSLDELKEQVQKHKPGEVIRVEVRRDGKILEMRVKLTKRS